MGHFSRERDNWEREFDGVCDLDKLQMLNMDRVNCGRLSKETLDEWQKLVKYLAPIVQDDISFQILSMIVLFDTEASITQMVDEDEASSDMPGPSEGIRFPAKMMKGKIAARSKAETILAPVNQIRNQYINLLQRRRDVLGCDKLKELTDLGGLNRVMHHLRGVAQLVPKLMQ